MKQITIRDVMVENVVTVSPDYTVKHAATIMNRFSLGCVVVLQDNEVVGIMTERDLLKRIVAVARDPEKTFVREIMTKPVIVIGPDVSLEAALELMFKHRIKKLPVMEHLPGKDKLIGLVTMTDIARLQPKLMELLRQLFSQEEGPPPKSMEKVMNYYLV
jgi:CBS domain-containing protein